MYVPQTGVPDPPHQYPYSSTVIARVQTINQRLDWTGRKPAKVGWSHGGAVVIFHDFLATGWFRLTPVIRPSLTGRFHRAVQSHQRMESTVLPGCGPRNLDPPAVFGRGGKWRILQVPADVWQRNKLCGMFVHRQLREWHIREGHVAKKYRMSHLLQATCFHLIRTGVKSVSGCFSFSNRFHFCLFI